MIGLEIFDFFLGGKRKPKMPPQSITARKNFESHVAWFIIVQIFIKEVIPGASTRAHYSEKILKPRCSGGLGKARIPKPLDEAGEDRLGLGPYKVIFSTTSCLSFLKYFQQPAFISA
jgi:hypothetical protein